MQSNEYFDKLSADFDKKLEAHKLSPSRHTRTTLIDALKSLLAYLEVNAYDAHPVQKKPWNTGLSSVGRK